MQRRDEAVRALFGAQESAGRLNGAGRATYPDVSHKRTFDSDVVGYFADLVRRLEK